MSMDMLSSTEGWAVGGTGSVLKYDGTGWKTFESGLSTQVFSGVDMLSSTEGWIVGPKASIYKFNGTTWNNPYPITSNQWLNAVSMISSTDGFAVGDNGTILRFDGTSWNSFASPLGADHIRDIEMLSATEGWAVTTSGKFIKWDGSAWTEVASPTSFALYNIDMVSSTEGWAVGYHNGTSNIFKYNGTSWSAFTSPATASLYGLFMRSSTEGWATGSAGEIFKYDGTKWSQVSSPTTAALWTVYMPTSNEGWAMGSSGTILRYRPDYIAPGKATHTFDAGQTVEWLSYSYSGTQPAGTLISFRWATSDDGTNWSAWTSDFSTLPLSRYIKQEATLSTTDTSVTPSLCSTTVPYSIAAPTVPAAPTIGTPSALSAGSIRWYFTDNAANEKGFKVHDSGHAIMASSAMANLTYLDETGLTANTQYTRHVHAYNLGGDSTGSANASRYTLGANPNVTANKTVSTWYNITDVAFTNAAGFGAGGMQYYRYAWNQNSTYTFTDTEPQWTTGSLTTTSTANGSWHLHVKSYNAEGFGSGAADYGPYYYEGTSPSSSNHSPANGAANVAIDSDLTLTLSDTLSGIDWTTFAIQLTGSKGYLKTYTDLDTAIVSKTGTPASYNVTVNPDADFGYQEVLTVTVSVNDIAGNPVVSPVWSFTIVALSPTTTPAAPAMGTPAALSTTSIRWNFTDNANNEEGVKLHDTAHAIKASSASPNLSYLDETGLTVNTGYTRHVLAYNALGDSAESADASRYTLSPAPNITADKTASTWYSTGNVVFTNAAGFGAGAVQYYRYAWGQNAAYTFTDTESQWTTGTLTMTATASGSWYLHVKSFNGDNVANGAQDYGPYYYDGTAPSSSNLNPANSATSVALNSNLTFTLSDAHSGVEWTSFQIQLSGDKGYSKTYTDLDTGIVSKTGASASYDVTVNPDTDFGYGEQITVTVAATDVLGNLLVQPAWLFTSTLLPSDAVLWWQLNDGTGQTAADSIGSNTGMLGSTTSAESSDPAWTAGKLGNALNFDGINDYAFASDSTGIDLTTGMTFEMWVKLNSAFNAQSDANMGLLDKGVYQIFLDRTDGKLKFSLDSNAAASWSQSLDTPAATLYSMAVYNGKLYTTGYDTSNVYYYDGTSWTTANWLSDTVYAMTVHNGKLYAAGFNKDGATYPKVYAYDGTTWSVNATSALKNVYTLASYQGKLYAGGAYGSSNRIQEYNGTTWSGSSGAPFSGEFRAMAVYDNKLYAAGGSGMVYVKDGTSAWTSLGTPMGSGVINQALAVYNGKLYVGVGGGDSKIYVFDGTSWTLAYDIPAGSQAYALAVYNGRLYAGTDNSGRIYTFDGTTWVEGFVLPDSQIYTLAVYNGRLYAGTDYNGIVRVYSDNQVLSSTTGSWDTNWHHIAATYDGTTMKLYVDGALNNSRATAITVDTNNLNLLIGKTYGSQIDDGGSPETLSGKIDEVVIYNRALIDTEVAARYNLGVSPPAAPTIGTPTALSTTSIRWSFTDNANNEIGFTVHDSSHAAKASSATQNLTYLDETGLTANTQYTRHVHSYNGNGDSTGSANASKYTSAATPNVTADKTASTWYSTSDVVFTNAAGFGSGGVQYYRYIWDQNATYTFDNTETQWTTGTLTKTSTASGSWYLHVKSYNGDNTAGSTADYGPYNYDGTAPAQVTGLSATAASTTAIDLTWTASSDSGGSGLAGYKIEKAPDVSGAPGAYSQIGTSATNSYTASGGSSNTKYWFRARAYDNAGNDGGYSAEVSRTTLSSNPTEATASDGTYTDKITVSWSSGGAQSSYRVYRDGDKDSGTQVYDGTSTTFDDTISGSHTYYVYSKNGESALSAGYSTDTGFTSGGGDSIPPSQVTGLSAVGGTSLTSINLAWTAATDTGGSGLAGYKIERASDVSGIPGAYAEIATSATNSYTDATASSNTPYWYRIRAYDGAGNNGLYSSSAYTAGIVWTQRLDGNNLNSVAKSGARYVAVGAGGVIMTSEDGATWIYRASGTVEDLISVVWSGSKFVAVGGDYDASSVILTSADGISWSASTDADIDPWSALLGIAWSGTKFVAVGQYGVIYTSPDGATNSWTPSTGVTDDLTGIVWTGTKYLAVSSSGGIFTSPDAAGGSWTQSTDADLTGVSLTGVTWSGTQFVAVGYQWSGGYIPKIFTSPDGTSNSWTPSTDADVVNIPLFSVAWTGSQFVAVGGSGKIFTSPSGATDSWTPQTSNTTNALTSVFWSGSQFVVAGGSGTVLTSPDGSSWTTRRIGTVGNFSGVTWSGSQFVAVGQGGVVFTSTDGSAWTPRTSGITSWISGVASSGSRIIAVGYLSSNISSTDGVTWTPITIQSGFYALGGIVWSGTQFVTVGENVTNGGKAMIYTSPDGTTWTDRTAGSATGGLKAVAWSGSQFAAVGLSGLILTSPDGVTWTSRTSGTAQPLSGVAWSGTQFVAVGAAGTIITSPDGITWTGRTSGTANQLNAVASSGTQFIAVGNTNTILTSPDGITWVSRPGTSASFWGIAWSPTLSRFVAGAGSGTVYTSP